MNNSVLAGYLPIFLFMGLAFLFPVVTLFVARLVRPQTGGQGKLSPYECGVDPESDARQRYAIRYYVVAILFVIFDVEAVFIMLWALGFYELGWPGYIGIAIFIGQLVVVLIYEWGIGALDFGPDGLKIIKAYKRLKKQ